MDMEKDGTYKMDRHKIKNAVVLERVREGKIMKKLIKTRKINWLVHWLRRNCLLKDALGRMVNDKKVRDRSRGVFTGVDEQGRTPSRN